MQTERTKVTVTGGAGNVGYALSFMIGAGRLLGPNQKIDLTILEIPYGQKAAQGLVMELKDSAFPVLSSITETIDPAIGFKDCDIAILVGARPRGPGMTRSDLLKANAAIFKSQAKSIENNANKDCKVVVVGNPANTNAAIVAHYAPSLSKCNITSLTRLDMNRAKNQISEKINVPVSDINNVIIWGNHSSTQFPYIGKATATVNGEAKQVSGLINDTAWVQGDFISTIQGRGKAIIDKRGLSSAGSAASAICDHIYSWLVGTKEGEFVSMGVMSDGSYGVPEGINFSFPVTCKDGAWTVVQDIDLSDEFSKGKFQATLDELKTEKQTAIDHLETPAE